MLLNLLKHGADVGDVEILTYKPGLKHRFKALNMEWLGKYFEVEQEDIDMLDDPETFILKNGGEILFAKLNDEIVGCCALKHEGNKVYELVKMAVTPKYQGLGLGKTIGRAAIDKAIELRAVELYLITNSVLKAAINVYENLGFVQVPVSEKNMASYCRCDVEMIFPSEMLKPVSI